MENKKTNVEPTTTAQTNANTVLAYSKKITARCKISGECSKVEWYTILDYIDKMKMRGWFIIERDKSEWENRVSFYYELGKWEHE